MIMLGRGVRLAGQLRPLTRLLTGPVFLGVDVGTGSARAGVVDTKGEIVATKVSAITTHSPVPEYFEQSTADIWRAVCEAVRGALSSAGAKPSDVKGVGFDATCSLAVLGDNDAPVSITPKGKESGEIKNVILWMDHRSVEQARRINATKHSVLKYVGGTISPEMETPKLLWLKENKPDAYNSARLFLDLSDWLVYNSTGVDTRSVCKWTFVRGEHWDASYFRTVGLGDLADEGFKRIGADVRQLGTAVGKGLTAKAASDLGLSAGTPVSVGVIDAHAGGVGMVGAKLPNEGKPDVSRRMGIICGTSSCHMASARQAIEVPGVWGPYYSAMIPGWWLAEGGQSATGALIDFLVGNHPAHEEVDAIAKKKGVGRYQVLNGLAAEMAKQQGVAPSHLARDLHVYPDFHGNRSPVADPTLKGMVCGVRMSAVQEDLVRLYVAAVQAVAYQTRHIVESLNTAGYKVEKLFVCGGWSKNEHFLHELADIVGCDVVLSRTPDSVLVGSAILGAVASGHHPTVEAAMAEMNGVGGVVSPDTSMTAFHAAKYKVFHRMLADQQAYRKTMASV